MGNTKYPVYLKKCLTRKKIGVKQLCFFVNVSIDRNYFNDKSKSIHIPEDKLKALILNSVLFLSNEETRTAAVTMNLIDPIIQFFLIN